MSLKKVLRNAPFALRIVQRNAGRAAIVYQRRPDKRGRDRLQRIGAINPLAFTAASSLLRAAVKNSGLVDIKQIGKPTKKISNQEKHIEKKNLMIGPFHPLDANWGARVACFAILSAGLRNSERLFSSASHLTNADANEAAWWLGVLIQDHSGRAVRAFRILMEAVQ